MMNSWIALAKGENEELLCCFQTAISYYEKAAEENNFEAMEHLARIYEEGLGVQRDLLRARDWWLRAQNGYTADAFLKAGDIYSAGTRTNQDIVLANQFYKKSIIYKNERYSSCDKEGYKLAEAIEYLMNICSESPDVGGKYIEKSLTDLITATISVNPDNLALRKLLMKTAPGYINKDILQKAAGMGSIWAMYRLGSLYLEGDSAWGLGKDTRKGFEWILQSAMNGNTMAMLQASDCYAVGIGTTQNYDEAAMWAGQAAKFGGPNLCNLPDSLSYLNLNSMIHIHWSAVHAVRESIPWHENKAKAGAIDAMLVLAGLYEKGEIVPKDSVRALYWHELAVKFSTKDNIKSDYYLGRHLIPWPDRKARSWTYYRNKDVTCDEHGRLACNLAGKLERGQGVPQDTDRAKEWYAKAAQAGNLDALHRLGCLCKEEIREDPFYIAKWRTTVRKLPRTRMLLKYAEENYPTYTQEAFFWLLQAAIDSDHGDPDAMLAAACLLSKGDGISRNATLAEVFYKQAIAWNKREAEKGNVGAMYNLAVMYRDGDGLTQNAIEADYWFKMASRKELEAGEPKLLGDICCQNKGKNINELKVSLHIYAAISGRYAVDKFLFYSPDWDIQRFLDSMLPDVLSKHQSVLLNGRSETNGFIARKELKINQSLAILEGENDIAKSRKCYFHRKHFKFFFIVTYLDCENEMKRVQLLTEAAQDADTPTCVIMINYGGRNKRQEEFIRYISHRANSFIEIDNEYVTQAKKANRIESVMRRIVQSL